MSSATTAGVASSKSIYDTSIYINAMRNRAYYDALLPRFVRSLPTTYLCAVVAQELKAGCRTAQTRGQVEAFFLPFRRTRRLITPVFLDWEETGDLLAQMLKERPNLKDKLPRLINDTLIALCGARIGAVIYTANEDDFSLIRDYKRFHFEVI